MRINITGLWGPWRTLFKYQNTTENVFILISVGRPSALKPCSFVFEIRTCFGSDFQILIVPHCRWRCWRTYPPPSSSSSSSSPPSTCSLYLRLLPIQTAYSHFPSHLQPPPLTLPSKNPNLPPSCHVPPLPPPLPPSVTSAPPYPPRASISSQLQRTRPTSTMSQNFDSDSSEDEVAPQVPQPPAALFSITMPYAATKCAAITPPFRRLLVHSPHLCPIADRHHRLRLTSTTCCKRVHPPSTSYLHLKKLVPFIVHLLPPLLPSSPSLSTTPPPPPPPLLFSQFSQWRFSF